MKTVTWGRAGVKTMGEVLAALLDLSGHGPRDGDPQQTQGRWGMRAETLCRSLLVG